MGGNCSCGSNRKSGFKPLFDAKCLKDNPNGIQLKEEDIEGFIKTKEGYQAFLKRLEATEQEIPIVNELYKAEVKNIRKLMKKNGMGGLANVVNMFDENMVRFGLESFLESIKADITNKREQYQQDPEAWEQQNRNKKEQLEMQKTNVDELTQKPIADEQVDSCNKTEGLVYLNQKNQPLQEPTQKTL